MKIIALGDTHGRKNWEKIVSSNTFDKVIFIGDYFDTHEEVSPQQQKENFENILNFKRENKNKVILLCGNHDFHYLRTIDEQYSGFQRFYKADIQELLHKAIDEGFLQMCHIEWNYLFVHAGITKTWCNANGIDMNNLSGSINDLFKHKPNSFKFTRGKRHSPYGDDITQSPIWVRPRSLYEDKIENYIQVVGHTTQDQITGLNGSRKIYSDESMIETLGVIFIDTLGTSGEFLEIIDGVASSKK